MPAKKKVVDPILKLEKQIASTKIKLNNAHQKNLSTAEREVTSLEKKLASAKNKLTKLRDKAKAAATTAKSKKTPVSTKRAANAKEAVAVHRTLVSQLNVELADAKTLLAKAKSTLKSAATIEKESARAIRELKAKGTRKKKPRKAIKKTTKTKPQAQQALVPYVPHRHQIRTQRHRPLKALNQAILKLLKKQRCRHPCWNQNHLKIALILKPQLSTGPKSPLVCLDKYARNRVKP